jgi:hypothetical protein
MTHETMELSWKDGIYQREELARLLEPLAQLVRNAFRFGAIGPG